MKQFFESYGGVALGILALLVLIAMIAPVGNIIKTSLQGTTNKFASSMNGQLDDAMVATAEAQESATEGPVDLTNINKSGVVGDFSAKGNLVEINGTQFRVLEVNGAQAKVMSMENIGSSSFNSGNIVSFDGKKGQKYAGYNLDNAMSRFYDSLPSEIQKAILEQNINQSLYSWNTGTSDNANFSAWRKYAFTVADTVGDVYHLRKIADINIGYRKIFALDIDDAIAYLGSNSAPQDVNEMFWNQRNNKPLDGTTGEGVVWLRSASTFGEDRAYIIDGINGWIANANYSSVREVRPAFVIDLSLL